MMTSGEGQLLEAVRGRGLRRRRRGHERPGNDPGGGGDDRPGDLPQEHPGSNAQGPRQVSLREFRPEEDGDTGHPDVSSPSTSD